MHLLEIDGKEFRVRNIEVYRFLFGYIHAHSLSHCRIAVFIGTDTVSRMNIQRCLHPPVMQILQEAFRIREKILIPRITGPAAAIFRIDLHQMPVHIDNCHSERNLLLLKAVHQFPVRFFRILIITAPPVSKCKSGKHGRLPAQVIEIF